MNTVLAVDIGNTNITAGAFRGGKLLRKTKIPTNSYSSYARKIKSLTKDTGAKIIISSVVPLALARFIVEMRKHGFHNIVILGKDKIVPIKNKYRIKREVGQDRLVNAYAAKALYGTPAVIIDLGTAITFDILSKSGDYLGGLILPGIELSLCGLYRRTALLPKVELKATGSIIGKDTVASIRGGILFGFGAMCDGLIARYKKILGAGTKVIATGGNAELMKRYTKSIQKVNPDLTLQGLSLLA